MQIALLLGLIMIGFLLLIKGADFLVSGAASFARKLHISELAIGLTIVALGTSAPELVVNIISGSGGHDEVVFGNIIGSNIFNLFLILGVAGLIHPLVVQKNTVQKEVPFSFFVGIVLFILLNDQLVGTGEVNQTNWIDGIILLSLFGLFLVYVFRSMKSNLEEVNNPDTRVYSNRNSILRLIGGLIGLGFGGKLVVDNAVELAELFEVSQKMIGLTIVAAGTSLPELATSAVAAFKKQSDIAIGNVIGSNIFNMLLVLGVSTSLHPLEYNAALNIDFYIFLVGTLMLYIFMFTLGKKKLDRYEALLFLITFVGYMTFLIVRG